MRLWLGLFCALFTQVAAWAAEVTLVQHNQGLDRPVRLVTPDASPGPWPLILALHGAGDDPDGFRAVLNLDGPATAAGFAVAWPVGVNRRWQYASPLLRGPAVPATMPDGAPVDDLAFLEKLVTRLVADGMADPARVFLTGFSVGGLMTVTAGCAAPRRFAAIAVVSAGVSDTQAAACAEGPPLPVLFVSGDGDPTFPWAGFANARGRMLSRPDSQAVFARRNGCGAVGAEDLMDARDATDCHEGVAVRLLRLAGAGHLPMEGTGAIIAGFFSRFRR
ncbi:alpha/beta hydrolase family esterase [Humitalea rosea]|uniref:alpha/beta hydrolase family esterase n=1 Tax=Humitalea rosea TaxID=990373 RepID=UPI0013143EE9|nr:PHB depolymerase family esterase [Humitalea rosea]